MSCEAIFCYDTATVRFAVYPDGFDGARVIAQISAHALRDHFGACGGSDTLVDAYARHAAEIDGVAISRYRSEPQAPILLRPADFDLTSSVIAGATLASVRLGHMARVTHG